MNKDISIKEGVGVDISVSMVLSKFKTALSAMERVVGSRSTLPILNNVLIKADKNGVELIGTDLEIGIKFFIGGKVETEGSITIPGKTLITLVNSLHGETVVLKGVGGNIEVKCGDVKATINATPADDYPILPEVEGGKSVKIGGDKLKQMLSAVDFSASRDESRQLLTGVLVDSKNDGLVMAATDSYRLSEVEDKKPLGEEFKVIIPAKTIVELKRLIKDGDQVEIRVEESQIMFLMDNVILVSRLIEGEYPNYQQIIPTESNISAIVDVQELMDAIKSASVFSVDGGNSIKLVFDSSGLKVTSEASQVGNFNGNVEAKVEGGSEEVGFNAKYVLDGLASFDTPKCELKIGTKTSPVLFTPSGVDNRRYIVMPLRG
ncbi:MAG: DNA polymerase III subunit beta [Patescibacteria group bacterium]